MSLFPITKSLFGGLITASLSNKGNGVFGASISPSVSVGGGQAKGVLSATGSIELDLNLEQAVALGFHELNDLLPASIQPEAEVLEEAAKPVIDAAIEKL